MHYVHLVLVQAEEESQAIEEAEYAISEYGDGHVWDWYTVGGRWEGYLKGKNVLCYADDPEFFRENLRIIKNHQDKEYRELVANLTGALVSAEQVSDHIFGLPVVDKAAVAEEKTRRNKCFAEVWQKVLTAKEIPRLDNNLGMLGYFLRKLSLILTGDYYTSSGFWDSELYKSYPDPERAYYENDYLVVIDIHN